MLPLLSNIPGLHQSAQVKEAKGWNARQRQTKTVQVSTTNNVARMTTKERAVCVRQLKNSLKDPHSLRRLGSPSQENASGIIKYSATNSFGGRVTGYYVCATGLNVQA